MIIMVALLLLQGMMLLSTQGDCYIWEITNDERQNIHTSDGLRAVEVTLCPPVQYKCSIHGLQNILPLDVSEHQFNSRSIKSKPWTKLTIPLVSDFKTFTHYNSSMIGTEYVTHNYGPCGIMVPYVKSLKMKVNCKCSYMWHTNPLKFLSLFTNGLLYNFWICLAVLYACHWLNNCLHSFTDSSSDGDCRCLLHKTSKSHS